jgi:hypothetical protein
MKPLQAALPLLWLAAAGPAAVSAAAPTAEASMLLAGSITVTPQGTVQAYTVDKPAKLAAPIQRLLAQNVPHWRFEPVIDHGHAVAAKAAMHLRIVATSTDKDHYAMRIGGQWFGDSGRASSPHAL